MDYLPLLVANIRWYTVFLPLLEMPVYYKVNTEL